MLIVTDTAAVDAAFAAKTPRPILDLILEVYPDCTIDRNGRAHAPHDGYECPLTGCSFRAGEYLPFERDEMDLPSMRDFGRRNWPQAVDRDGNKHEWDGTRAQNIAAWAELRRQTREVEAAQSKHLGEVGAMYDFGDLTITYAAGYAGAFSTIWLYVMRDAAGNVVVYKGSKRFERTNGLIRPEALDRGATVAVRAKVKAHGEREGIRQTLIERPKISAPLTKTCTPRKIAP